MNNLEEYDDWFDYKKKISSILNNESLETRYGPIVEVQVTEEEWRKIQKEIREDSLPNRCIDCKYFDDRSYHADDISACVAGSCIKCQRNLVTSDPYNEVPSWCPMKGDEE